MAIYTVYRAKTYDITQDEFRFSSRYWTIEGAERANLIIDRATALDIDEADLMPEGCTDRNFEPDPIGDFHTTSVRPQGA
ncbi:hypothetical protein [Rhizobium redzepovicii]|uniref:hypothetical protein n=1 Tax=Rhizobium redzepovicii TaxID=2867518 RepID=UPI0028724E18|nr:hypothetical protein [Rhizobium redzepovicii]MDR9783870.1 hypothetical protein [Rhizobium redzepovicii]